MKKARRLTRWVGVALLLLPTTAFVSADSPIQPAPILITEVQTGSQESASQEFIELFNASEDDINLANWRLRIHLMTLS